MVPELTKNVLSGYPFFVKKLVTSHFLFSEQHLYPRLNHFLLKGPFLDMRNVPLLTQMLNSSDLEYLTERSWIIQLMAAGLRTPADYYIYKKNHVFQQIMSLYNSTLCDVTAKVGFF